jgi:tetratricopeptide (TPR) repeat protein
MRNTSHNLITYILLFTIVLLLTGGRTYSQNNPALDNKISLAQGYEAGGQLEKAEELYRELMVARPFDYFYFESLNRVLVAQKKYEQSIEVITQRIKQTPQDYNLFGMLGSTHYTMGQTQKAYEVWENGIAIGSQSYISYRTIANYAIENRAFDKAIDILQRGKQYAEDPLIFSMDLAAIYAANMRFSEAAKEYCDMIDKNPSNLPTVKNRLNTYLSRVDAADKTIAVVQEYAEQKNKKEYFDLLAFIYQTVQKYAEAFETIDETDKKFSGNGTGIFIFAQEAYRNRKYEWASKAFKLISQEYPNSSFSMSAEIGYAKTLEAALDQKVEEQEQSWKPYRKPAPLFVDEYTQIAFAYNSFIAKHKSNATNMEATFRIAEIYRTRILDYGKADSLYDEIIKDSPVTTYAAQSLLSKGKIKIESGDLDAAGKLYEQALLMRQATPDEVALSKYMLAKIYFWKGDFQNALTRLSDVIGNLSTDFANDALELSALINTTKKDSLNLFKYASADLLLIQNKSQTAATELKTLADNPNVFILNDFAKIRIAEIFISENDFLKAVDLLQKLSDDSNNSIFAEKSTLLLAQCFNYGILNPQKAMQTYQKILEKFPNSLYFDHAREELNSIQTNNGKK